MQPEGGMRQNPIVANCLISAALRLEFRQNEATTMVISLLMSSPHS